MASSPARYNLCQQPGITVGVISMNTHRVTPTFLQQRQHFLQGVKMDAQLANVIPLAAAGYSLLYLLFGGGLGGAVLIFIVAKMLGK